MSSVATNLRKGVVEYCVLALLRSRAWYGVELAQTLSDRGIIAGEGTLYPLLARLREAGHVQTEWIEAAGRPRRYYELTDKGREQLANFQLIWASLRDAVDEFLKEGE